MGSNLKLDTVSLTMGEKNYLSLINLFLLQEHSHENSSDGEIVCQNKETYTVLLKSKVTVWQYKFSRNKDWVSRWKIEFQETVN